MNSCIKINQLLTAAEAANLKGMKLGKFLYYAKAGRTPEPVLIGAFSHHFYDIGAIEAWEPVKLKPGRKSP